jgi:hypothetical protein
VAGEGQGTPVHYAAEWQPPHPPVGMPSLAGVAGGGGVMDNGMTYDARVYRT